MNHHRIILILAFLCSVPTTLAAQWDSSIGARYMSRHNVYGADLSEVPALGMTADFKHRSGFQLEGGAVRTLGVEGEFQSWSAGIGYSLTILDFLTAEAGLTHFEYSSDSANILAGLSNAVSLGVDLDFGTTSLGISYDNYFGDTGARFYTGSISSFHDIGPVFFVPLAMATFMSQDIDSRLIIGGKGNAPGGTASTVTGLSGLSVHAIFIAPLLEHMSVTFHPYYLYSPKSEISGSSSRLIWTAGVRVFW